MSTDGQRSGQDRQDDCALDAIPSSEPGKGVGA